MTAEGPGASSAPGPSRVSVLDGDDVALQADGKIVWVGRTSNIAATNARAETPRFTSSRPSRSVIGSTRHGPKGGSAGAAPTERW